MTISSYNDLIFNADHAPLLTCLTCGDKMKINNKKKVSEGYEVRTFFCDGCDIMESFIFDMKGKP
jgi:hypothetical protein